MPQTDDQRRAEHIALVEEALELVFPTDTFEHQPRANLDELFTDSLDEHNAGAFAKALSRAIERMREQPETLVRLASSSRGLRTTLIGSPTRRRQAPSGLTVAAEDDDGNVGPRANPAK